MNKTLSDVFGSELPADILETLQAEFDNRVAEAEKSAEIRIREEFATRFEHDKDNLIEALDRMSSDVASKFETEKATELKKLKETRNKFEAKLVETRKLYRKKIAETAKVADKFIFEQLSRQIKTLNEQRASLAKKKVAMTESFNTVKSKIVNEQSDHMQRMEAFVIAQTKKELGGLLEDRALLTQARAQMIKESREKLKTSQTMFIKESAKKVEKVINETLKREMSQLHRDLEANRQNMFGRRIFEAVAAEYMTSYLAEGSELRQVQKVLESKEKELSDIKTKLTEAAREKEVAARKSRIAEDRAQRSKIMTELTKSLRSDSRSVMESMLQNVKTESLRSAYNRYLPMVLNENQNKVTKPNVLSENHAPKRMINGNSHRNIVDDLENNPELDAITRLAGIRK